MPASTRLAGIRRGGADRLQTRPYGLASIAFLVGVFLYLPILVVILFSFNSSKSLVEFNSLSLDWYRALFRDGDIWASVWLSVQIAAITSLFAVTLGTALAIGLNRLKARVANVPNGILSLTIITPEVALAFSLLLMFTTSGIALSRWTITLSHVTFSLAYVTLVVRARLTLIDQQVEEAAMDLYATRLQSLWYILLPQLRSALFGAAMLVFVISFDDFVTSFFTSGIGTPTLPVRIYAMIRFGVSPEINAIATLMMVGTIVIGIASIMLTRSHWGLGRTTQQDRDS